MAIHEYNEGDHPAGFQGLRVVRMVGGEQRQVYLPFRVDGRYLTLAQERALRAEAQRLDDAWAAEQYRLRAQRRQLALPRRQDGPGATGVAGIKLTWKPKWKRGRLYRYLAFQVQGSVDGRRFHRYIHVSAAGARAAWRRACQFYAEHQGISARPLQSRLPDPESFVSAFLGATGGRS